MPSEGKLVKGKEILWVIPILKGSGCYSDSKELLLFMGFAIRENYV